MILPDQSEVDYHNNQALSRSRLWTCATRSPKHAKHSPAKKSKAMDLGKATHIAVLEPDRLDAMVMEGPIDRRGNKWKDIEEYCSAYGKIPLTTGDYSKVFYMRDAAQEVKEIRALTSDGALIEHSGYSIDQATGLDLRCRPDIYHPELRVMGDLKTAENASPDSFARSIAEYGYHMQQPFYKEVWEGAGGDPVDAFFFIVIETTFPFVTAVYELMPSAIIEGSMTARRALDRWKECQDENHWPAYGEGVMQLDIPKYAYRESFKQAY